MEKPWEALQELIRDGSPSDVIFFIDSMPPSEISRGISRLSEGERGQLFSMLPTQEAADLLEEIPDAQAADLLEEMPPEDAAIIVDEIVSDERVDILAEVDDEAAEQILDQMEDDEAAEARRLLTYPDDSAGGIMITEFLSYDQAMGLSSVLDDLRRRGDEIAEFNIQYIYVTGVRRELVGVLRLRDIVLKTSEGTVADAMVAGTVQVSVDTPLRDLREIFEHHAYVGVPVVDAGGVLVGVVVRDDLEAALAELATEDFLKASGIVDEELRSMPLMQRSFKRLSWLSVNVVLNLIAASIIALNMETLEAAVILAVFLPIISDMSGCSGNQAVAVSIRELSLGFIDPRELARVFGKEVSVGFINGALLGLLLGGVAWLWKGNPYLGAVVGLALALNTVLAVVLGGALPLILRRFHKDPALASGPILTTVTDLCGFLLVFLLAGPVLSQLS